MKPKLNANPTPEFTSTLPVLPMRNTVLFPSLFLPLSVGRPASVAAVQAAQPSEEKTFLALTQREGAEENPKAADLYTIGTRAVIKRMAQEDGTINMIVQGIERVVVEEMVQTEPFLKARVRSWPVVEESGPEVEALHRAILDLGRRALELVQLQGQINIEQIVEQSSDPVRLAYLFASMMSLDAQKEQALLEAKTTGEVLRLLHDYLTHEVQVLELRHHIASQAQTEINKEQREYVLRQQLRAIQDELGDSTPERAEVEELRRKLREAELPEAVQKEADRELTRLERLPPAAPDHQLVRTYLELLAELPWNRVTEDTLDLVRARAVLDEDHYGLEEIKDRILEHLAVMKLNPKAAAPILCFVGPPGVGKTSLGQSIARALGRKFERLSLGGLHDEAELRGHRRTYIGAMPGRVIQGIRRAGVRNPVLMLDEVDKLGRDFRGDPAAALLEILDPAQNGTFRDNYLDLPFDLSKVFFITTANTLETVPAPLLDRMEVVRLSGYSEEEKCEIARRYLVPRQLDQAGLVEGQMHLPDQTLQKVIRRYAREAGVRQLERNLAKLARKVALRIARGEPHGVTVGPEDLSEFLGPERFHLEEARKKATPGVATGLAWTEAGGEVLFIEALLLPGGRGGLQLTGHLGTVMQESAKAAQSLVWAQADELGIDRGLFRKAGVHVHVPAGAVPKDGPSAGVALVTALTSLYTHTPVRTDTAMTGEITLTGLVLPVGGIKEKVLAARRAGIRRVILPRSNEKDLQTLPEEVRKAMEFILVERMEEALAAALPATGVDRYRPLPN